MPEAKARKRIEFPSYIGYVRKVEPSFLIRENFPAQIILFQIEGTELFYNSKFPMQIEGQRVGLIREEDVNKKVKVQYVINGMESSTGKWHTVLKVMGVEKMEEEVPVASI